MENQLVIHLENVGKRYGRKVLFCGIDKVVQSGQCIAITGKNGSGKSTLLKLIAGLVRPTSGTVEMICGNQTLDAEQRLKQLGFISPELVFYPTLTGVENLLFFANGHGCRCTKEQAEQAMEQVGLQTKRLLSTYSTGMEQRLKFALLKILQPALWLLDEPSANLDDEGKALAMHCIKEALQQGASVTIATNERWEAQYADDEISLT